MLQQEDWLVMTKATFFERPMCRTAGVILGNHSFFLRVHEFGVIAQTREADRVVQTRNYVDEIVFPSASQDLSTKRTTNISTQC